MKRLIKITKIHIAFLLGSFFLMSIPGCERDILEESPKDFLSTDYIRTPEGMDAAVIASYAQLRYFYPSEPFMAVTTPGTDTWMEGGHAGYPELNRYTGGLDAAQGQVGAVWSWAYPGINTTNAVIQLGPDADMSEERKNEIIAEAKYIRAKLYFLLVQTYGEAVIDLGGGDWKFNTSPAREQYRAPLPVIYDKIIEDLTIAKENLPVTPTEPGRVGQAAAYHLLSKVYLTRAGYDDRDPGINWSQYEDGRNQFANVAQPDDYQMAYDIAKELIDNAGQYGVALLDDYADIHAIGEEHNSEVLLTVEYASDPTYTPDGDSDFNANMYYFFRPFYEQGVPGLTRSIEYGRPWIRTKPTEFLVNDIFYDKVNDSRFNKVFQRLWLVNLADASDDPVDPEDYPPGLVEGDTALFLASNQDIEDMFGGVEPGIDHPIYDPESDQFKPYVFLTPTMYSDMAYDPEWRRNNIPEAYSINADEQFPSLNKWDDNEREELNGPSVRPHIVYKFSEVYLIAAEAAHKLGIDGEAADLINVLRHRAAYPGQESANEITAGDITIDFILDERARELTGEYMRWFDLVRTGKLLERVENHNTVARTEGNIQPHHVLRPIPQDQIDLSENDFPQNPGY